jgi:hypothetical protein
LHAGPLHFFPDFFAMQVFLPFQIFAFQLVEGVLQEFGVVLEVIQVSDVVGHGHADLCSVIVLLLFVIVGLCEVEEGLLLLEFVIDTLIALSVLFLFLFVHAVRVAFGFAQTQQLYFCTVHFAFVFDVFEFGVRVAVVPAAFAVVFHPLQAVLSQLEMD